MEFKKKHLNCIYEQKNIVDFVQLENTAQYTIVFVPVESIEDVSTKPIITEIGHQEAQSSNDLQQPNSVEEKYPMIVPNKDNETSISCTK